jgi:hypothetical protein
MGLVLKRHPEREIQKLLPCEKIRRLSTMSGVSDILIYPETTVGPSNHHCFYARAGEQIVIFS